MSSMNAITRAVATVRRKIPNEILRYAFVSPYQQWNNTPNSLDDMIVRDVIRSRVLVDCNLVGGQEDFIRLQGLPMDRTNEMMSVVHVPKSLTNGRTITSVLHLSFHDYTLNLNQGAMPNLSSCSTSALTTAASTMVNSFGGGGISGTTRLEIIAENTILIRETTMMPRSGVLRCVLSNDEEMNNLSIRSFVAFCELAALAVKSHIYTTCVVRMDEAVAQFGKAIGAYRQIIDGYSDAEEQYIEFLTSRWQKIAFMNDRESMTRFIRAQISSGR